MIPKIIHYCWFGKGEIPKLELRCIESWKKIMPDYELRLWNEDTFDINSNQYVKEAYENRKFAFVSDYVRLYALYQEGGIYLDTDVEVFKDFSPLLHLPAFSGFETNGYIISCMIASEKGGTWIKDLLTLYDGKHFVKEDKTFDVTPNTVLITKHMQTKGFVMNDSYQEFKDLTTIFPSEYFCPLRQDTGKINITDNSYCTHHFAGSWIPTNMKLATKIKKLLTRVFGAKAINRIIDKMNLRIWKENKMNK